MKTKTLHLALVVGLVFVSLLTATPAKAEVTPWPVDGFWNEPAFPSIFDWTFFGLYGEPPTSWTCHWDFGDGTTYDECYVGGIKQYAKDGDYTVSVQVTNEWGWVSTTSRVVSVRTHDVTIAKFAVPQSASAGQTRQITVNVRNTRYPEKVQVELYKNDMVWIGTLIQDIPVRSSNRTTPFSFNYTFTTEDARVGKVTFKAMAFILSNNVCDSNLEECDDWPVDNCITALQTRVSR